MVVFGFKQRTEEKKALGHLSMKVLKTFKSCNPKNLHLSYETVHSVMLHIRDLAKEQRTTPYWKALSCVHSMTPPL